MSTVTQEEEGIMRAHNRGKIRGNASNSNPSAISRPNLKKMLNKAFIPQWPTSCLPQDSWIILKIQQLPRASTCFNTLPCSSTKKTRCHPCQGAKATQVPVEHQEEGVEDGKEAPRTIKISRLSRDAKV